MSRTLFFFFNPALLRLKILVQILSLLSINKYSVICGLVVRVLGYRTGGPGSIPGTTRKKSSGSGTGSTQPREYN
jgi:hypothetical protein